MATVVLTVVGTAIGGPIGGFVGGLIGQRVDQAIFGGTSSRTIEGGRMKDLTVQTSSYGEPIVRVYGTLRLPGNVIWSSGLKEVRNEKTESSGGKGRRQNVTTVEYSYRASFAVALSGRAISDVGRVWADGKLLRDAAGKIAVGGEMRVYRGEGFQKSDPMIEALEGQNNVNGFTNLSYVVFEDLALGEYANRIPNLTFEVIGDTGGDTGGEILLSTIVSDICQLSDVAVFDVGDLNQMVGGYLVAGPMKSRAAIEELARVYQFDVVEQENGLLFRKLGRLSEAAILADDLVQSAQGARPSDKVIITRQQDMELPREIGLSYIDPSRDYQTGYQRARRLNVASDIVRQSGLPLVLSSSQAKTASEIQLDLAWYGRETINFALPHKYDDLLPGDIVTMASGSETQDYLLQETEIGPEGVQCQAVKFSNLRLDRSALADSGPVPAQQVEELAESLFFHLDMPAITGENVTSPVFFWAAAAGAGKWPGAGLFISRDNDQTYSQLDYTNADAISGIVENILPDGPVAYWDYGNELLVRLDNPDHGLPSAALEAVLDGANIAWVGGEIIQFQQATFELGGFYRLTGLLRGRRGTERYISQHSISETFILLNRATVNTAVMYHSDIGLIHHFKVVTAGADVEDAPSVSRAYGAAVLKPFSPVHGKGQRDGAGTLALTWIRRSRVGGDWMDNADVPLGENFERYDIEILNGGAVVRTLTSDVSEVIYPASSQIEDFGATQAILDIRIFQISDNIGRGWPLILSV